MTEKQNVRDHYKQLRNEMSQGQVETLSLKICEHLISSDLFLQAEYLYAYAPLGNEVDIRPVVEAAWQQGKQVAFPKVFGEEMRYFEVTSFSQLKEGTFHVMEPEESAGAAPVDWRGERGLLVLVPGVAFDRKGNRMGYGKGYYDRHFADLDTSQGESFTGVAYELQIAERLPTEDFDLSVTSLVTELGMKKDL
ncbi:MAG: 5-formyltetrahydrofolate cyclo-ligase [Lachnospiraceae bacterium]|nr:5-formyltetrahydrofolate cyclo-ligase [Clostridiales bacterium]MCC8141160.1 5-formyltetrahydrofolate cyclo-ligase [Lachnospiraceae bacterium]